MDEKQFAMVEALYLEMFSKMVLYARCSLNYALAEEAVQETFRVACQNPEKLCRSENPQGWLIQTLKYTIQNIKRSFSYTEVLLQDYLATQKDDPTAGGLSMETQYGLVSQTEEFQLLQELVHDQLSVKEMAEKRGISVDACKKRIQRAKKYLRENI